MASTLVCLHKSSDHSLVEGGKRPRYTHKRSRNKGKSCRETGATLLEKLPLPSTDLGGSVPGTAAPFIGWWRIPRQHTRRPHVLSTPSYFVVRLERSTVISYTKRMRVPPLRPASEEQRARPWNPTTSTWKFTLTSCTLWRVRPRCHFQEQWVLVPRPSWPLLISAKRIRTICPPALA